jgi:hypothetical protein
LSLDLAHRLAPDVVRTGADANLVRYYFLALFHAFFSKHTCKRGKLQKSRRKKAAAEAVHGFSGIGVVGSNIHWQWTPNQYLASGIGAGSAWIATHMVVAWRDRYRQNRQKRPSAGLSR